MSIKKQIPDGVELINPIVSQLFGLCLSIILFLIGVIIFESTIAEWSNRGWGWFWRIIFYCLIAWFPVRKFFLAGLGPVMPIGHGGIPRIFGKPLHGYLYDTGRHWTFPGKGNKLESVDMRSDSIELNLFVTTKDNYKMVCKLYLNFLVYDPLTHAKVKNFKKTFESMLGQSFLGFSAQHNAQEMLQMDKATILNAIAVHIEESIPPQNSYRIEDFGIEIQPNTIAVADGFEFANPASREAFEAPSREEKEKEAQQKEIENFLERAKQIADASGGSISFNEAYLRVHQQFGKNPPQEKILRIAGAPDELVQWLKQIFR